MTSDLQPWERVGSEQGPDLILFRARYDWYKNPRNSKVFKRVILEARDFVNVVAVTAENRIVVVRQFRFGAGKITTEIPAGLIDPGEAPEDAARRELEEETGYVSDKWKYLGWVLPNPAFLNNRCHSFLATDLVKAHEPRLEEGEDISVAEWTLDQIRSEFEQGDLRNALGLVALMRVFDLRSSEAREQFG